MTNSILPVSPPPLPLEPSTAGSGSTQRQPSAAPAEAPAAQSEAVTLSEAAQTTTQLLDAARQSEGINQEAVAQIRAALQNGSYNVAPEDLAQAIAMVLKETS